MQLIVNGLLTNYQTSGKGKEVLFLHGWGDSINSFKQLVLDLSGKYKVILLDLPGFGKTASPPQTWGLSDYSSFVADFIDKAGIKPFAVVGHSNGGAVAIRGLSHEMIKADKLVLLASAGIRNTHKARKKVLRMAAKTAKLPVALLPKRAQTKIKKHVYKTIGSDLFVAEHLQETFKRVIEDDIRQEAGKIDIPTLLIYGDNDTATPVEYGQMLAAKLPNSKLEVLAAAGHFVHHDKPAEVTNLILKFLGGK